MNPLNKFINIIKAESEVKLNINVNENIKYLEDEYIKNTILEYLEYYNIEEKVDYSNRYFMLSFILQEIYKTIQHSF